MGDYGTVPRQTARAMMREAARRELVTGDRLASEAALMGYFNVSRGSLREALRLLSFLGAINIRSGPDGGARMASPQPRVVGSTLAMALQCRGATLRSLIEARATFEPAVATLAAVHRSDQDLATLGSCLIRIERARGTDGFADENHRFHQIVADAAGNEVLALLVPALTWMSTAIDWHLPAETHQRTFDEQTAIAEAIRDRDTIAAATLTTQMFEHLLDDLKQHRPQQLAARILWPDVDELPDTDEDWKTERGTRWTR